MHGRQTDVVTGRYRILLPVVFRSLHASGYTHRPRNHSSSLVDSHPCLNQKTAVSFSDLVPHPNHIQRMSSHYSHLNSRCRCLSAASVNWSIIKPRVYLSDSSSRNERDGCVLGILRRSWATHLSMVATTARAR